MKRFNPEGTMFSPSAERLSESEEALYGVLVPELRARAIKMDEFRDLYGDAKVDEDKKYIETVERNFGRGGESEASKKMGALFEAVVDAGIRENDFMGPDAMPIVPSRYDDIVNKVDSIVEFEEKGGGVAHVALGIDVSTSEISLARKFSAIRSSIEKGDLSTVRYFKSDTMRGELRPVVRVVIGADDRMVKDISDLMLRAIRMKDAIAKSRAEGGEQSEIGKRLPQDFARNRNALAEHPIQWVVLLEMKEQLEVFTSYAHSLGKERVAEECAKILHIVEKVIDDKRSEGEEIDRTAAEEDKMFQLIRSEARKIHGL